MFPGKLSSSPTAADGVSVLSRLIKAYLSELKLHREPNTISGYASPIRDFERWVSREGLDASTDDERGAFTKPRLMEYLEHLGAPRGTKRKVLMGSTRSRYIEAAHRLWQWAYDDGRWSKVITRPPPKDYPKPQVIEKQTVAPTWAEMDAAIMQLFLWPEMQVLACICRCTGLRVWQAARLLWGDFDFSRRLLIFRGELGKSRAEKKGRTIPVSEHLLELLAAVSLDKPYDPASPIVDQRLAKQQKRMGRAWHFAKVPPDRWQTKPFHAFRKGFKTRLIKAGELGKIVNSKSAVDVLIGHKLPGVDEAYVQTSEYPLTEVVALVPPIVISEPRPMPKPRPKKPKPSSEQLEFPY